MTEVTILSKKHRRTKEPITIPAETWEAMQANGEARNFIVVSTTASPTDEAAKQEYIRKFTEKVSAKVDKGVEFYISEYKRLAKTDLTAAQDALLKAAEISPDNPYVKRQLEKNK